MARITITPPEPKLHSPSGAAHRKSGEHKGEVDFEALCAVLRVQTPEMEPLDGEHDEMEHQEPAETATRQQGAALPHVLVWPPIPAFPEPVAVSSADTGLENNHKDTVAVTNRASVQSAAEQIPALDAHKIDQPSRDLGSTSRTDTPAPIVDHREQPAQKRSVPEPRASLGPVRHSLARGTDSQKVSESAPLDAQQERPEESAFQGKPTQLPSAPEHPPSWQPAPAEIPPARQLLTLLEAPASPLRSRPVAPSDPGTPAGDIRILRMKLKPEALGDVDVTLRRHGDDMRIQITVTRQEAADALKLDLGLLRDRVTGLLGPDGTHSISIVVQPAEAPAPATGAGALPRVQTADPGVAGGGSSGPRDGDRPPPHKQHAPSPFEGHDGHETLPLRSAPAGLVV